MSQQNFPPLPPERPPGRHPRPGAVQPVRALLVVVIGVVVAVYVLARTATPTAKVAVARSKATTSAPAGTTSTSNGTTSTTSTTVPTTTTSTTLPPSSVTVLVLNGWTTYHAATYFQHQLAAKGYDTRAPQNAISSTNKTSLVFFTAPAYRSNALAIASALNLPSTDVVAPTTANDAPVPSVDLSSSDIILLVGADISTRVPPNYNG